MRTNVLVVAVSVLSLVGCGGSGSGEGALSPDELAAQQAALAPPPPPPTPARVRVIHASVDSLLASLSVYVDGAPTPLAGGIAAGSAALTELPPGVHQFGVRPAEGDAATPALFEFTTSSLAEGVPYTFVVHGLAGSAGATLGIVAAADDTAPGASGDTVPARFFHAIAGVGPVDVCKPGARTRDAATPIFASVTYGTFGTPSGEGARGTWANVLTGVASRIQVRSAHASRPCSGNVVGNASIAFDSGAATTLVGTGRHGQGRRDPGTPKQILVCGAGSATCSAVALSAR